MSQENVEIVRKAIDAFDAFMHGELSVEAAEKLADPQIDWHWHRGRTFPDMPEHLRGAREVVAF